MRLWLHLALLLPFAASAQAVAPPVTLDPARVHYLAAMTSAEVAALDPERTVVLLPGGVVEAHGPYLPTFTDGYLNERLADELAAAVVAGKPGWHVLVFPTIPLGTGGANEIAGRMTFPGSYGLRFETLRAVYLDLATQLGDGGFRWAFVLQNHGAPLHNRALDEAGDFFRDTFGGRFVNLTGLEPDTPPDASPYPTLTPAEDAENGADVHAGMSETSRLLYVRPDLVRPGYREAAPQTGTSIEALIEVGARDGWPGYFGSPRLATAARGEAIWARRTTALVRLALAILDGADDRTIPRYNAVSLTDPGERRIYEGSVQRDADVARRQAAWLDAGASSADTAGVAPSAQTFLAAFDSLRWAPFAAAWAPEATVFLPEAEQPRLLVGREAVLAYFQDLFDDVRATASDGAPSLGILRAVRDLRVQPLGTDAAVVTFHLADGPEPGRRSVVWRRDAASGAWWIVHLHASPLSQP